MIKLTFYTFVYNLEGGSKLFETHIGNKIREPVNVWLHLSGWFFICFMPKYTRFEQINNETNRIDTIYILFISN